MKSTVISILRQVSVILVSIPLWSCEQSTDDERGREPLVLNGLWYNGPETSQFLPCDMYESGNGDEWIRYGSGYWLDSYQDESAEFVEHINEQSNVHVGYETVVYISVEARLSEVGDFGHMGQYEREVIPIKLMDIRAMETCPDANE